MTTIAGINVDPQGRCAHYCSDRDIVANKCATCNQYWACYKCHAECTNHPFGRMPLDEEAILCGNCGFFMDYNMYHISSHCPNCHHDFNPGCSLHSHLYFLIGSESN
ncbi:MAG: CHY zinc finger protein [Corynebacterium sp.]|nr:CHY zinc finger protein [Corynebacterium sp.]